MAYTSVLKSHSHPLDESRQAGPHVIPVIRSWRLNERHYGQLQGLNKSETAEKYGDDQVFIWRRSYDIPPEPISKDDPAHAIHDPRYKGIDGEVPSCEALKQCRERVLPFWHSDIAPAILSGKRF